MFIVAASIQNTAKCKLSIVIRFRRRKDERPADIQTEIFYVYWNIMNLKNVMKWRCAFSRGRINVQEQNGTVMASVISYLALSDYHLFLFLKISQNFHDDDEIKIVNEM